MSSTPESLTILPSEVQQTAARAIEARRAWNAAPEDHDHDVRHRAQEVYAKAEGALTAAVIRWVAEEAGR